MFNRQAEFTIKIVSGGIRSCKVRFPSDDEWAARARKMHFITKDIGHGESIRDTPVYPEVDRELFEKIRLDDKSESFDEFEAQAFIDRLERCPVASAERVGNSFCIGMNALQKFPVAHVLKIPSQKDINDFYAAKPRVRLGKGYEKLSFSLDAHVLLWSRCIVSTEGYASDDVPNIHKYVAAVELVNRVGELMESDDPEA